MMKTGEANDRQPLYFAYGSNLNGEDLEKWCRASDVNYPLGRSAGRAWLPDHRLVFNHFSCSRGCGVCNVRPAVGSVVPGVLFRVRPDGWQVLDWKEGASRAWADGPEDDCPADTCPGRPAARSGYERIPVTVLREDGREAQAQTYRVPAGLENSFEQPDEHYLAVVRAGLASHGLGLDHLEAAAGAGATAGQVDRLFVYGTLMAGECRHSWLAGAAAAEFQGEAGAAGSLLDLGSFPGMLPAGEPAARVHGELYRLADPPSSLATLDRIEGFYGFGAGGSLFRRSLVWAEGADQPKTLAWVYLYSDPSAGTPIPSGDWRRR